LAIFVEGDRDRRFFANVVQPLLAHRYSDVRIIEYRQRRPVETNKLMRAMTIQGYDHLFVADRDSAPCVGKRKEKIGRKYSNVPMTAVVVVYAEIESWFMLQA